MSCRYLLCLSIFYALCVLCVMFAVSNVFMYSICLVWHLLCLAFILSIVSLSSVYLFVRKKILLKSESTDQKCAEKRVVESLTHKIIQLILPPCISSSNCLFLIQTSFQSENIFWLFLSICNENKNKNIHNKLI